MERRTFLAAASIASLLGGPLAKDLVEVMDKLGFPAFTPIGYHQGGHVPCRMARVIPRTRSAPLSST